MILFSHGQPLPEGLPCCRWHRYFAVLSHEASVVATSKVAYPEARAALARGFREGLLEEKDYRQVVAALQSDWPRYLALEISDSLAWLAGELAEKHRLRGFDAIHLAAAVTLKAQVKGQVAAQEKAREPES